MPLEGDMELANLDSSGASQSARHEGLTSQEERSDDAAPPLGVELTVYRLLNMSTMIAFCFAKGILTYEGLSTVPTTLDWISGGVLAAALYWLGLYEGRHAKKWEWFFQEDLAPAIGYCTKCAVGAALYELFGKDMLRIILAGVPFTLVILSQFCTVSRLSAGYRWGIIVGTFLLVSGAQALHMLLNKKIQATGFLTRYGPNAPPAAQYRWFGMVGTVVGRYCGIALVGLPLAVPWVVFSVTGCRFR